MRHPPRRFEAPDPYFAERVRASFARQKVMAYLGAELAAGDGEVLIAQGEVVKPGRNLVITRAEVYVIRAGREDHCATMQQTLMTMHGRPDTHEISRKEKRA